MAQSHARAIALERVRSRGNVLVSQLVAELYGVCPGGKPIVKAEMQAAGGVAAWCSAVGLQMAVGVQAGAETVSIRSDTSTVPPQPPPMPPTPPMQPDEVADELAASLDGGKIHMQLLNKLLQAGSDGLNTSKVITGTGLPHAIAAAASKHGRKSVSPAAVVQRMPLIRRVGSLFYHEMTMPSIRGGAATSSESRDEPRDEESDDDDGDGQLSEFIDSSIEVKDEPLPFNGHVTRVGSNGCFAIVENAIFVDAQLMPGPSCA